MQKLKYLFEAEFYDGTVYKQNKQDTSLLYPPTFDDQGNPQGKNSFTDVIARMEEVKRFTLIEQQFFGRTYSVFLDDGHFEIDKTPFFINGWGESPGVKYKLVYCKDRTESICSPARYRDPRHVGMASSVGITGDVLVVDSAGKTHIYKNPVRTWKEKATEIENGEKKTVEYFYILPKAPLPTMLYRIGWECVVNGKKYQRSISIA